MDPEKVPGRGRQEVENRDFVLEIERKGPAFVAQLVYTEGGPSEDTSGNSRSHHTRLP